MKLIFAQGNPGTQYAHTRHNVGFIMLDIYAKQHSLEFTKKPKFYANIAETTVEGEKLLLVKPTTFYNETGQAARALIDFYKLDPAQDFLVIHDDLSLPFGTIRTREQGSDAGNNGVKSLNAHIGQHHKRIKVGIYNELRERIPDADFVLSNFTAKENDILPDIYTHTERFIQQFITEKFHLTKVTIRSQKITGEAEEKTHSASP